MQLAPTSSIGTPKLTQVTRKSAVPQPTASTPTNDSLATSTDNSPHTDRADRNNGQTARSGTKAAVLPSMTVSACQNPDDCSNLTLASGVVGYESNRT